MSAPHPPVADPLAVVADRFRSLGDLARENAYLLLLREHGWPMSTLGEAVGISRQAVHQRIASTRGADRIPAGDLPGVVPAPPKTKRPLPSDRTLSGLRALDLDRIEAEAVADVQAQVEALGHGVDALEGIVRLLAGDRATQSGLIRRRNAAALSLAIYGGHRAVWRAAGWRTLASFAKVRSNALGDCAGLTREQLVERARERGVREVARAEKVLERVAPQVVALAARISYLEKARDRMVYDLVTVDGVSQRALTGILGVLEPRVSQIMREHRARHDSE